MFIGGCNTLRVLLINPWAINNDQYYASGFVSGMNQQADLDFVCNYYYRGEKPNDSLYPYFFEKSQMMPVSKKRKIIRGLEYIRAWEKIYHLIQKKYYDIVHIHWMLMYPIDLKYLNQLRKHSNRYGKLVLTAHNVLPHINGERSIEILRKIYGCFDEILVHGEIIKEEFSIYFPEYVNKVSVQYHGEYYEQSTEFQDLDSEEFHLIKESISSAERVFIMFGAHFYNKGTDRLIKVWNDVLSDSKSLLLVLGRIDSNYVELKYLLDNMNTQNVLVIGKFVDDNLLNYCISNSDCVVVPYRHASMSGIVYTAASFEKAMISTKCGAIAEYLENKIDSFLCENDRESLGQTLLMVNKKSRTELAEMGMNLKRNISTKYSWDKITEDLYREIYCKRK